MTKHPWNSRETKKADTIAIFTATTNEDNEQKLLPSVSFIPRCPSPTPLPSKDLFAEHDSFKSLYSLDDRIEGPPEGDMDGDVKEGAPDAAVVAFWRGINLVRGGEYAESIAKFSEAVAVETARGDARIKSLALEYHGSFLYLMGDMAGALEHLGCVVCARARACALFESFVRCCWGCVALHGWLAYFKASPSFDMPRLRAWCAFSPLPSLLLLEPWRECLCGNANRCDGGLNPVVVCTGFCCAAVPVTWTRPTRRAG